MKKPDKKIIDYLNQKCEEIDAVLSYRICWFNEDIRMFGYLILRQKPAKVSTITEVFNGLKKEKGKMFVITHLKHDCGDDWLDFMKKRFAYAGPLQHNGKEHPFINLKNNLKY